jgi:hypothetical protein
MPWTVPTKTTTSSSEYASVGDLKRGHTIAELTGMYTEADSSDQSIFAEMRSNLLLVAGEHYQKRESKFFRSIRDSKELSQEQKLRLTKNHIRKICQTYANNIMSMNPGVGFSPKDEKSMHDQKVADMHHSVWRDAYERYQIDDLVDDWCDNFVQLGEVAVKIFFDPGKGHIKGFEPTVDPEGNPVLNEMGQPTPDQEKPIYSGEFVFEEIYGFNLLRPSECKDLKKAEWLCIRKMVNKDDMLLMFPGQDAVRYIQESVDDTYMVFDAAFGGYYKAKNQVSVREFYFRPCRKYPKGYFYITTKEGILAEGELPGGIFPIVVQAFDKIQTTPRGRSPVKQMRPYQAEINRSASKMAEHQITLGDDKLLIQNGTKVSAQAVLPGIRSYSYTGAAPTILEGRNGSQYLDYMNSQITELYGVMNVQEDSQESPAQLDPYVLLYRAGRQKKKFQRYIKRFEKFLVNVVKTYLALAKVHLEDDALIYAIGKSEQINIPEFKQMPDLCYEVKVEAQSDDIESKLGKQLVLNHTLQYVGTQLKPEDIGKVMRQMPFADFDESFDDLTIDYDSVVNDILALDRGEQPPVNQYDNHTYCIKRLIARTRKPDFRFLAPQIQNSYAAKIQMHQQMDAFQKMQIQRAEQGFIPTSGALITCQMYVNASKDPNAKPSLVKVPYDALQWLIDHLQAQGTAMEPEMNLPQGAQSDLALMITRLGGAPPSPGAVGPGHPGAGPLPGHMPMGAPNGMGAPGRTMPPMPGMGMPHPMAMGGGVR